MFPDPVGNARDRPLSQEIIFGRERKPCAGRDWKSGYRTGDVPDMPPCRAGLCPEHLLSRAGGKTCGSGGSVLPHV